MKALKGIFFSEVNTLAVLKTYTVMDEWRMSHIREYWKFKHSPQNLMSVDISAKLCVASVMSYPLLIYLQMHFMEVSHIKKCTRNSGCRGQQGTIRWS